MKTESSRTKFERETEEFLVAALPMREYCSDEEIANTCKMDFIPSIPPGEYKKDVLLRILSNYDIKTNKDQQEEQYYTFVTGEVELLQSIMDEELCYVMFGLMLYKKKHPHSSGWIKLDKEELGEILYPKRKTPYKGLELIYKKGYEQGLIDFRVIGSKNPITCFSIPEVADSSPVFSINEQQIESCFQTYLSKDKKRATN